jgi:hypothetical protein
MGIESVQEKISLYPEYRCMHDRYNRGLTVVTSKVQCSNFVVLFLTSCLASNATRKDAIPLLSRHFNESISTKQFHINSNGMAPFKNLLSRSIAKYDVVHTNNADEISDIPTRGWRLIGTVTVKLKLPIEVMTHFGPLRANEVGHS